MFPPLPESLYLMGDGNIICLDMIVRIEPDGELPFPDGPGYGFKIDVIGGTISVRRFYPERDNRHPEVYQTKKAAIAVNVGQWHRELLAAWFKRRNHLETLLKKETDHGTD